MWSARLFRLFPLLFIISVTTYSTVRADDDTDDYDVKSRVSRISLIEGEVTIKRSGAIDWEHPKPNFTLVEGDTVATGRDGRVEIQVKARDYIRVSHNAVVRLISLRDEGIVLSVEQGSVALRLSRFDREHQYFEVDGPRSTFAVEKEGMYRVDVGEDGRVRLSVSDGGTARVYSDTSGFLVRSGRTAELVTTGDESGDWTLAAVAPVDEFDQWVSDRDRYVTQRPASSAAHYDGDVWGAEELDAFGDWINTSDYGWIWRPNASAINAYSDWAPYRYGYWNWVEAYGWTWVGYEPWGWAPYHYGRWVYYNGYWAWCPRSAFYRKRSWWRPALVAFISLDLNQSYCWYPLHYRQRDPRSRNYHHQDPPRPRTPGAPSKTRGYLRAEGIAPAHLHAVSEIAAKDLGRTYLRPFRPADGIAAQVLAANPTEGGLNVGPRRPIDDHGGAGRSGRNLGIPVIDRPTGATTRRPGVSLDDELRRSRIFNGREPRNAASNPTTNSTQNGAVNRADEGGRDPDGSRRNRDRDSRPGRSQNNGSLGNQPSQSATPGTQAMPSQPAQENGPAKMVRPADVEPGEKRSRDRELRIEGDSPKAPRVDRRAEPRVDRSEQSTPVITERGERSAESPRQSSPGSERRESPRSEPTRSEPPRRESPRSESPRSESPRSESPRSESPRSEPTRSESPRSESPRSESPRSESPRSEPARSESPRSESPRSESPRSEPARSESPRSESPRSESPRSEPTRSESPRSESPKADTPKKPDN